MIHSPLFEEIREYLRTCRDDDTVFLFVPYIKADVLEELLDGVAGSKVIVTTWHPNDIRSGSSDLRMWPFCRERGIALYVSERLHLKVYSVGMVSAILATGNISKRGLMQGGNHEAGIVLEHLDNTDKRFLAGIRAEARLVDDEMHEKLARWLEENPAEPPKDVRLEDIVPKPERDSFLISALPMTRSVDDLVTGYANMTNGKEPSADSETTACIFHDLANYGIDPGLGEEEFVRVLSTKFFEHPFIQKIDEFISPEAYFGRIKEWVQDNCADVPVPSRRKLTDNVQVLLEWFERLGGGKYVVDVPGRHSQRIKKIE